MTPDQVKLVQDSFAKVAPIAATAQSARHSACARARTGKTAKQDPRR